MVFKNPPVRCMCNELMDQFNTGKEGRLEEIIRKKENKGRREEKRYYALRLHGCSGQGEQIWSQMVGWNPCSAIFHLCPWIDYITLLGLGFPNSKSTSVS